MSDGCAWQAARGSFGIGLPATQGANLQSDRYKPKTMSSLEVKSVVHPPSPVFRRDGRGDRPVHLDR